MAFDGMTLFEASGVGAPLAHRMRPQTATEFVGQGHLVGEGHLLARVAAAKRLPSLVLWGPPGSGKTTLARLIAAGRKSHFEPFSAVTAGVPKLREILEQARLRRASGGETLLFVDEIHRFNKAQQDAFLQHVEDGTITLIGATTENPSFELNAALLSRVRVLTLRALSDEDLTTIVLRALVDPVRGLGLPADSLAPEALKLLVERAGGDARSALNVLEAAASLAPAGDPIMRAPLDGGTACEAPCGVIIDADVIGLALQQAGPYDRAGEHHYDTVSALIKTIRGSDPDAAMFWLARMLNRGEDALFIARRLVILASEDIGNADPQALGVAISAMQALQFIGMPEGKYPLTQAVTYLAMAPKSNAAAKAVKAATDYEEAHPGATVPLHLRNAPTKLMANLGYGRDYRYPHDFPGGWIDEDYWPDEIEPKRLYEPTDRGFEATLRARRAERDA